MRSPRKRKPAMPAGPFLAAFLKTSTVERQLSVHKAAKANEHGIRQGRQYSLATGRFQETQFTDRFPEMNSKR
jgi:hypothetical protein